MIAKKFFTSGFSFNESELELRSKFQMINIALVLSSLSLIYGMSMNLMRETPSLVPVELFLLCANVVLFFILRQDKTRFAFVSTVITFQFTFFFLYLVYTNEPSSLKHIWLFTYPIILLYLQHKKFAIYWFMLMLFLLLIAPIQPFYKVSYSPFQVSYIAVVLIIVTVIINFYQSKMQEARDLVLSQQEKLKEQVQELVHKDTLLSIQSKQAVMGEMISMIAHQWRQPLSTVTLSISNLQIKRLLGEDIEQKDFDKTLEDISKTVLYLSDTIDDFQTYFHPNKEIEEREIHELLERTINFVLPRIKSTQINIEIEPFEKLIIETYTNEFIQVLLNIINNAIDILVEDAIDKPEIKLSVTQTQENVSIFIKDNAKGIATSNVGKIFDPYFSTKGKNGTGLGLYMSQMIVQKQFNGEISVESSQKGTIFKIRVPYKLKHKL
jgi:signal transduction histidine kinase